MKTRTLRIFRDGTAPSPAINIERRRDRATDELIGLCKGMLADGHLQDVEAKFLIDWLHAHAEFATEYPFNSLIEKIEHALLHGVLDHEEEKDIVDVMLRLSGNPCASIAAASSPGSTSLPLDAPPPSVSFDARLSSDTLLLEQRFHAFLAQGERFPARIFLEKVNQNEIHDWSVWWRSNQHQVVVPLFQDPTPNSRNPFRVDQGQASTKFLRRIRFPSIIDVGRLIQKIRSNCLDHFQIGCCNFHFSTGQQESGDAVSVRCHRASIVHIFATLSHWLPHPLKRINGVTRGSRFCPDSVCVAYEQAGLHWAVDAKTEFLARELPLNDSFHTHCDDPIQ